LPFGGGVPTARSGHRGDDSARAENEARAVPSNRRATYSNGVGAPSNPAEAHHQWWRRV